VRGVEAARELADHVVERAQIERPAREPLAEALAVEQLEDEERLALVLADVEDVDDRRRGAGAAS
jgi:hypothetical protein